MSTNAQQAVFLEQLDRHRGILFKVANAYCTPQNREDLVQETITELWRSYPRFDGRAAFSTWMYRIAVNVAISSYRSETRKRPVAQAPESVLERVPVPQDCGPDERLDVIHELIEALEPLDRALMLLYLDDYPYAEIGVVLGITESSVGTKIARIKERLKRKVGLAKT